MWASLQEKKRRLAEGVLGSEEAFARSLSRQEIAELLN